MTILHHPSEETLAAFVNASLGEGNSLVVATHLAHCPECRRAVHGMSELGGELLERSDTAGMSNDAREACLARLDDTPVEAHVPSNSADVSPANQPMAPVALYESGKWQWVGPGVYRQFIEVPDDTGTRVFMLKAAPGTRLPDHRHVGTEWTCVLKGAFIHDHGRFGAGDFDEADSSVDHNPFVEEGEECICLVALNGHVEMTGWLGRLVQPLVRL